MYRPCLYLSIISLLLITPLLIAAEKTASGKVLMLPDHIDRVPAGNNFNDDNSEYSYKRMLESDNLAIFWSKEYGSDPMKNAVVNKRFDPAYALKECERFYDYYVNDLKMIEKGRSLTDKYKMLIIVFGGDEATAFGGGIDDKIGALWTPAVRIHNKPYGALAHELAHSFQYMSRADSGNGPGGSIIEMSAQYMLWQVYPEWMTFENYHLVDFMKQTHLAFLHPANMYHSPYVLEYWAQKHGKEFFGRLSRETLKGEDPVMTYKRLNSLSQKQFNDEMYDACRRFITWDLDRVKGVANIYANQHYTQIIKQTDDYYTIAPEKCPQNYGYNAIELNVPTPDTKLTLTFAGQKTDNADESQAGWRYGFLAYKQDKTRVYSDVLDSKHSTSTFIVPKDTEHLWLVVMGAPEKHTPTIRGRRRGSEGNDDEQWPYRFKIDNTQPIEKVITASAK